MNPMTKKKLEATLAIAGALVLAASLTAGETEEKVVQVIEKLGGYVTRDSRVQGNPVIGVYLGGRAVTDGELKNLKELKALQDLNLNGT
jgi:hypothetical protein